MSRPRELTVESATPTFVPVRLATPLTLANAAIDHFTYSTVCVTVSDGRSWATGHGAGILSVPWSWPDGSVPHQQRDRAMRRLLVRRCNQVVGQRFPDPLLAYREQEGIKRALAIEASRGLSAVMPGLAATLSLAALDTALHDGWARLAGRNAWAMYNDRYLARDLSSILGPDFAGLYPGDFLRAEPKRALPVQQVIGAKDQLDTPGSDAAPSPGSAGSDGLTNIKIKLDGGSSLAAMCGRLSAIHDLIERAQPAGIIRMAIDPNESFEDVRLVGELLDRLERDLPRVRRSIDYIEQPIARTVRPDRTAMIELSRRVPILADEAVSSLSDLEPVRADGWSGAVIKAARGQSAALLGYCWAKRRGASVTVQDLTCVGRALAHSAQLARWSDLSFDAFECNARQYAPAAYKELGSPWPDLIRLRAGHIFPSVEEFVGLYPSMTNASEQVTRESKGS